MKTFVLFIVVCIGCALAITNERRIIYHKQPVDRSFVGKLLGFEKPEYKRPPPVYHKHKKPLKPLPVYPHHYENHEHHYKSHAVKLHHHSAPQKYAIIKKVPYQVKVPVPRPVPVKIHVPKPYTVEKKIPVPVKVYVPHPYTVEKKVPYPVKVQVPVPQPYVVERKVPFEVKVPVEKPYIVHVPKPYPVYFDEHAHEMHKNNNEMKGHKMHKENNFGYNSDGFKEHKIEGYHYGGHKQHYLNSHKEHNNLDGHYHGGLKETQNGHYNGGHKETQNGHLESTPNFNSDIKFDDHEWKLSQDHKNNYYFEKKPTKSMYLIPKQEGENIYEWAKPQSGKDVYAQSEWNKPVYLESKPVYPSIEEWQKFQQDDKNNIYTTNEDWSKPAFTASQDWPKQENTIKFEDSPSGSIKFDESIWAKPHEISLENVFSKSEILEEAHPTARDGKSLEEQPQGEVFESLPEPQKLVLMDEVKPETNSKEQSGEIIYGDLNENKGNFKPPTDVFYINPNKDGNVVGSSYNIGSSAESGVVGSSYNIESSKPSFKIGSFSDANIVGSSYNIGSSFEESVIGNSHSTGSPSGGNTFKMVDSSSGIKPIQEYPIYVSNIKNGKEPKAVEATYRVTEENNEGMNDKMRTAPNSRNQYLNHIQRNQQYKNPDMPYKSSQIAPTVVYSDMMTTGSQMIPNIYYRDEMVPSLNRRYDYAEQPLVKTRKTPAHRAERSMRRMDFEPQQWARPNMIGWTPIETKRYDSPPPGDERS